MVTSQSLMIDMANIIPFQEWSISSHFTTAQTSRAATRFCVSQRPVEAGQLALPHHAQDLVAVHPLKGLDVLKAESPAPHRRQKT